MNKHVILLSEVETPSGLELIETLHSAAIVVVNHQLAGTDASQRAFVGESREASPLAILYQIPFPAKLEGLRAVVEQASAIWPDVPIVACDRSAIHGRHGPDNDVLKHLGFRAIAESPAQLPAVLRQVEDNLGTIELRPQDQFKSLPDTKALSLPKSIRTQHLRGAFALIASLHLASDQKEAGLAAISGIARLVIADRWSIFLVAQEGTTDAVGLETLAARNFFDQKTLLFDEEWQRELLDDSLSSDAQPTGVAQAAASNSKTIRKTQDRNRIIALPLVSAERVIGILEGVRDRVKRSFTRSESVLLAALTTPIAAALSNSVRIAEAERLSLTDELTRLHNARYLRQFLVNEVKRARRYRSQLAALFLDLDDFKKVNDRHGHLVGSHALMEVAAVVLPSVRDTDCVVRYGGDEFVVILPETGIEEAIQVADRIRVKIEGHRFTGGRRLKIALTASIGVAVFPQHALSPQQLIACADRAMYAAKAADKNCVRAAANSVTNQADDSSDRGAIGPAQFQRITGENFIS